MGRHELRHDGSNHFGVGSGGPRTFIDCRSLETKQVALTDSLDVAVMDTGTRHKLVDSAYNERRSQCEEAAAFFEVDALRDLSLEKLLASEKELDPLVFRRARHAVWENDKVLNFTMPWRVECMKKRGN